MTDSAAALSMQIKLSLEIVNSKVRALQEATGKHSLFLLYTKGEECLHFPRASNNSRFSENGAWKISDWSPLNFRSNEWIFEHVSVDKSYEYII